MYYKMLLKISFNNSGFIFRHIAKRTDNKILTEKGNYLSKCYVYHLIHTIHMRHPFIEFEEKFHVDTIIKDRRNINSYSNYYDYVCYNGIITDKIPLVNIGVFNDRGIKLCKLENQIHFDIK